MRKYIEIYVDNNCYGECDYDGGIECVCQAEITTREIGMEKAKERKVAKKQKKLDEAKKSFLKMKV